MLSIPVSSLSSRLHPRSLSLARSLETRTPLRGSRALHAPDPSNPEAAPTPRSCLCGGSCFGRRLLFGGSLFASMPPPQIPEARADEASSDPAVLTGGKGAPIRLLRPRWYNSLYAMAMNGCMGKYEVMISRYKVELFSLLSLQGKAVLEIGLGTGPNLKYYGGAGCAHVYGVDPNKEMENYARKAVVSSGLPPEKFSYLEGFAEALPVKDNTMDAVIGTLVLCSVTDVNAALQEVKRVLKPGGIYLFIEHVAAQDGSFLRHIQTVLDPLQQLLSDGCHLTRQTGKNISDAGFSNTQINMASIPNLLIFGPHVYGFAHK